MNNRKRLIKRVSKKYAMILIHNKILKICNENDIFNNKEKFPIKESFGRYNVEISEPDENGTSNVNITFHHFHPIERYIIEMENINDQNNNCRIQIF